MTMEFSSEAEAAQAAYESHRESFCQGRRIEAAKRAFINLAAAVEAMREYDVMRDACQAMSLVVNDGLRIVHIAGELQSFAGLLERVTPDVEHATESADEKWSDTQRLDILDEYYENAAWDHSRAVDAEQPAEKFKPTLVVEWFVGDGGGSFKTRGANMRECCNAALEQFNPPAPDSPA